MIKSNKINIILLIIVLISIINMGCVLFNDENIYVEENKRFVGIITNIKHDDEKIVMDVKNKVKYRITLYEDLNYELGDKVYVRGIFNNPPNNTVFNLFNYRKYLRSQGVIMIGNNINLNLVSKNKNPLYMIKNKIIKRIKKYKTSNYLNAFILADKSLIDKTVSKGLQNLGISHLFAISGMHVGMFILVFKKLRVKGFIIVLFLLLFLFVTGFPASFLRCLAFLSLRFINKKLNLGLSNIKILILCAGLLILVNPYLIYNVGFLFSVIITFFIILISPTIKNKNNLERSFYISFVCFLSSIPILALYFHKINFLTPLFNLLFVPLVSFVIFPFALITFLFPFFDNVYLLFINVFEYAVINVDKIKMLSFVIAKPNLIIIFVYYTSLYAFIRKDKKYIILFLIILIINLNMRFLMFNPEITFLDVGQGDSTIITLPMGKTIVIDTGGKYGNSYSIVENKTIPYLNSLGINKVDLLVLTHGDYDHMAETEKLIKNIKVKDAFINKGDINELEKELLDFKGVRVVKKSYRIGRYELKFLNKKTYDNENSNSIITYVNLNNNSVLLMADADKNVEKDIINGYNLPKMDILKVGHHGSKTSSSATFINKINPTYSIISVGKNNKYGHPNKEVLDTLSNTNVLRTDEDGSIKFVFRRNVVNKFVCKPYIIVER